MNEPYLEYLKNSSEWRAKREAVRERCDNICERCHLYRLDQVHHITYERIFNEGLEDLQGLCAPCHKFLHEISGVDPLRPSIPAWVSYKSIAYYIGNGKFRRIRIAKLPQENFRNQSEALGEFKVPLDIFFDDEGNPVFKPLEWEKYKTGSFINGRWYSDRSERGRTTLPQVDRRKAAAASCQGVEESEKRERIDHPEHFTSYHGNMPDTAKEVIRLFKNYPKIVRYGQESAIRNVRVTKTLGIVLSIIWTIPGVGCGWGTLQNADKFLAEGRIVLDHNRGIWVMID
jgi:hypothetical protein